MKTIDFSSKKDVLIRYADGVLRPMDEPHYEAVKIAPDTWQIASSGDYHYLVVGEDEAVSIDTGYGAGNLREYLEELCGKPVRSVINTHDHFDHTANNCYFDLSYMAEETIDLATRPFPSFSGISFPRDYEKKAVGDGDIISLKGRELEIINIPDHAVGSIAVLDRAQRILFCGDEFIPGGKKLNGSAARFLRNMEKIMSLRDAFDTLCGGPGIFPASEADIFYEAAVRIARGETTPGAKVPESMVFEQELVNGHIVYDWREPRPEDRYGGKGKPGPVKGRQDVLIYKDRMFIYDSTKTEDM